MFNSIFRKNCAGIYSRCARFYSSSNNNNTSNTIINLLKSNAKSTEKSNSSSLKDMVSAHELVSRAAKPRFEIDIFTTINDLKRQAGNIPSADPKSSLSVKVRSPETLGLSLKNLQRLVARNRIAVDLREQRYYVRPGRKKRLERAQKHRQLFKQGFKRLLGVVKDAKRKGY